MIQNTLIKFAIAFFIIFTVTACYEEKEGQRAVDAFLKEMSPELARKIDKIGQEISLTEAKIDKLSELKRKHPNYAGKIETARRQWEVLQEKLRQSLKDIREVVESSYVTYELDRIQGGNQFNKISGKLLSSVDEVLASAGTTKDAIEQALNEVEDEPLPLLGEVNENSSGAPEPPIERNTFETKAEPEIVEPPTVETIVETVPPIKLEPPSTTNEPLSSPNISSFCNAKTSLADARLNLMMMVISTEQAEQDALEAEIDKASTELERTLAMFEDEIDNDQFTALQENWTAFKNTHETEIIPAIRIGNNDEALEIANGIQAERLETMNNIIQALSGDHCD